MYERILVPLDGSALAEEALSHAEVVARKHGSEIVLFRVVETDITTDATVSLEQGNPEYSVYAAEIEEPIMDSAITYLKSVKQSLGEKGFRVQTEVSNDIYPAAAILNYAKGHGINLIVMSTHGRSGLDRLIFGSVTERVLRASGIPILVVPSGGWASLMRA